MNDEFNGLFEYCQNASKRDDLKPTQKNLCNKVFNLIYFHEKRLKNEQRLKKSTRAIPARS